MSGAPALRHQVGRLLLAGLAGAALEPAERAWLRMLRPTGVILFRRNIEEAAQTTALLAEVNTAAMVDEAMPPMLRVVDLEGGLVDRLRDAVAPMPSAAAVAATGSSRDAARHGRLIARAARLLGFNTVFAPVLDLGLPAALPVLRTRVAGADADAVMRYARPFLEALRREHVLGCGKHFPGLGGGTLDSHVETPRIRRTWDDLWAEDMRPYRELAPLLPLVMVSHGAYPAVPQAGDVPASVSTFWIHTMLRRRMGYTGLVVSDDMEMGGILSRMPMEDAAVRAIAAGTDVIEVCRDAALVFRAYEALLHEAERSTSFRALVRRAAGRVTAHRERMAAPLLARAATPLQLAALRRDVLLLNVELDARERAYRGDGR